ncbi:hypothetical protein [Taibaiella chishuiensis]|uniref:Secreted protein (Por secretion system target) n=1 Tax=Taibaiella chishuiensis TaxID=1434707 RepID=A0A2P8DAS8_9BACT|nr:hypothetical protein [Taibaiella chishuiensis]PSK94326.1 hypothetical protein B0I18_101481 [Taibaiella chishuiensis]
MKTIIRKTVIAASLLLSLTAASFNTFAQDRPVYDRSVNPSIGIKVENAAGAGYSITDQKGNVVFNGRIAGNKTFYIPTGKLSNGTYRFLVAGNVFQEFVIK